MIEELTEGMTGTYLITTQGSTHLWNLDEKWYVRNPDRPVTFDEILRGFVSDFNGFENHFESQDVKRWPKVGDTFLVRLPPPIFYHQSSVIKKIQAC